MILIPILALLVNAQVKSLSSDKNTIVGYHNAFRASCGRSSITWSKVAEDFAVKYLETKNECQMQHSNSVSQKLGENLAMSGGMGSEQSVTYYLDMWASEVNKNGVKGHANQMQYGPLKSVGCASRKCGNTVLFSCNYESVVMGNVDLNGCTVPTKTQIDEYSEKVGKSNDDKTDKRGKTDKNKASVKKGKPTDSTKASDKKSKNSVNISIMSSDTKSKAKNIGPSPPMKENISNKKFFQKPALMKKSKKRKCKRRK